MYNAVNREEILFHNNEMGKCTGSRTVMIDNTMLHSGIVEKSCWSEYDR